MTTQMSLGSRSAAGQLGQLFPNGPGATNTTGPQQLEPLSQITIDSLLSNLTNERAVEFVRRFELSPTEEFILKRLCPTIEQNITTVEWSEWQFNQQLAGPVAELTVSDLVTVKAHKRQVALTRFGKAARQSLDTMKTQEGQQLWKEQNLLIVSTFKKVEIIDILRSLLTCVPISQLMLKGEQATTDRPLLFDRVIYMETHDFGAINKGAYEMDRLVEKNRRNLQDYGVQGVDTVIMPPGSLMMYKNSEENMTNRSTWKAEGELGVNRQETYVYQDELGHTIQGLQAIEAPTFNPGEGSRIVKIDPMTRETHIGTKTVLSPWAYRSVGDGRQYRDTTVYNIDTDEFQYISFSDAFYRTRAFVRNRGGGASLHPDLAAKLLPYFNLNVRTGAGGLPLPPSFRDIQQQGYGDWIAKVPDDPTTGTVYGDLPIDDQNSWITLIGAGIPIPASVGILRPRIKLRMSSAIVMKKGAETCRNYEGFINALVADDVPTMAKIANYTMRTKATVGRPQNVRVIPDVMFQGYSGGGNFKDMFGNDLYDKTRFNETAKENVNKLTRNIANTPSAIYVLLPMESTATSFPFIDLFGEMSKSPLSRLANGKIDTIYDPDVAFPTASFYVELYELNTRFPPNPDLQEDLSACDQSALIGVTTMMQAWQCDHFKDGNHCMVRSSSHLSDELSVPGSRKIINGQGSNMRAKPIKNWTEILLRCP